VIRGALVLAALAALAPAVASAAEPAPAPAPELRIAVGGQLGVVFPVGLDGLVLLDRGDRHLFDVDVSWQPSAYWQSYAVGGAWHPFGGALFVGGRLRWLQLHPPWSRGYDADLDDQLGLGLEVGLRGWLDGRRRFLGTVTLGALAVPSDDTELPILYTVSVGLAYRVWATPPPWSP
jgi:hypothetical protein